MRTIWKFPLKIQPEPQQLQMPVGARLLHVDVQNDTICIWAKVDPDQKLFEHPTFSIVATGQEFDDEGLLYVGTVQVQLSAQEAFEKLAYGKESPDVWHIFEHAV